MSALTEQQLKKLSQMLLQEKSEYESRLLRNDNYGLSSSMRDETGELAAYDNHPGDLATEMYERGKDFALNENDEHQLEEVEQALERMKSGQYGLCLACDQPIPYERLEAVPSTGYCIDHVPDKYVSDRRPAEEDFLHPPFGRTSLDEKDTTFFDGEDAWQIVESWGNSNSPAMAESNEVGDYDEMFIEAEEQDGYAEPIESFVATDLYGSRVTVVRNRQYQEYMHNNEGDPMLEPDASDYDQLQ